MLFIDHRWTGAHGIGRFSAEVLSRLDLDWKALRARGRPSTPLDVLNPGRLRLSSSDQIYTPGFNAGVTRARQIVTIHDLIHLQVPSESSQSKRLYYSRIVKPAVRDAGVVLTVSETSKIAIENWLGNIAVRVVNVGNGCSSAFNPGVAPVASRGPYFVYVGNVKQHKNFDLLMHALALRPDYQLVVVTADRDSVNRKAIESSTVGQVSILSNITDEYLAAVYRGSLGLLFPSRLEGFGLPAVEAMSTGRPVAYWSGCRSVAEIVGDYGLSVDSVDDPHIWANAMDSLQLQATGPDIDPGRQWHDRYQWEAVALKVAAVIGERG